jgi:hypothetical protein
MNVHPNSVRPIAVAGLRLLWNLARVPVLAFLLLLAPAVELVCGGLFLLGLLVSIAFEVSAAGATFPFWRMIALSFGFGAFVIVYHAVIHVLSS